LLSGAVTTNKKQKETMAQIVIVRELQLHIFEQLQQSYPNEGGGFLLGDSEADQVTIREVRPVVNVFAEEEQFHRYAMTPTDWAKLEDEADAKGLTIVGYYHSHPDHPAIPSEFDRVHALPKFCYLITSVQKAKAADCRAWQLSEDRSQFDELALRVDGM
jgi:proteasome lid subunit RPN8/RPN11